MYNEKRVVLGIFIIGIIIISVIYVSAWSLPSWFKFGKTGGEEEELVAQKPAQAFVNVTGTASPPQVIYVSRPNRNDVNEWPLIAEFNFTFYANSTAGTSALPGTPGSPDVTLAVMANFTNSARPTQVRKVDSCFFVGVITYLGNPAKNYTCNVTMYHFDEPLVVWNISVRINDTTNNPSLANSSANFTINFLYSQTLIPGGVNWSSVQLGQVNILGDRNITVLNSGNMDIGNRTCNYLQINATALSGRTTSTEKLGGTNFSAGEPIVTDPCNEPRFFESDYRNVSIVVNHTISTTTTPAAKNLTFCLREVRDVSPQEFNTTINWVVRNNIVC